MDEIVIATSSKDPGVIAVVSLSTGTTICPALKNCVCDPGTVALVGGPSSNSGQGSAGDYVIAAQARKPVISVWQWGKSQEITTSIAVDESGVFCFGGTKSGRIFCWLLATGELISSFNAHYKTVTCLSVASSHFLASASEDGMVRLWSIDQIVSATSFSTRSSSTNNNTLTSLQPYRSWTPHSLPVTCLGVLCSGSSIRVVSGSADQTIAIHDTHANRLIYHKNYADAIESLALHPLLSEMWIGVTSGAIHILDLSIASSAVTEATSVHCIGAQSSSATSTLHNYHTKSVTSIAFSVDGCRAVSGSSDGSVRIWDTLTRQCIREWKPFDGAPIAALPDALSSSLTSAKQSSTSLVAPIGHLRKFPGPPHRLSDTSSAAASTAAAQSARDGIIEIGPRLIGKIVSSEKSAISRMISAMKQIDGTHFNIASQNASEDIEAPLNNDFVTLPDAPAETTKQKKRRSVAPPAAAEDDTSEPLLKRQDTYGSGLDDFVGITEDSSSTAPLNIAEVKKKQKVVSSKRSKK